MYKKNKKKTKGNWVGESREWVPEQSAKPSLAVGWDKTKNLIFLLQEGKTFIWQGFYQWLVKGFGIFFSLHCLRLIADLQFKKAIAVTIQPPGAR